MKLRIVKPKVNEHPNWVDEMDVYDGMVIDGNILLSNKHASQNIVVIDCWKFNLKWLKPAKCIQL